MTGDQIYADEVPTLLMVGAINRLAGDLLGAKENLTARKADAAVAPFEATLETSLPRDGSGS